MNGETDQARVGRLLAGLADSVEPRERLDAIIVAARPLARRRRRWRVAGAATLVAAAVATALLLTSGGTTRTSEPEPAAPRPGPTSEAGPSPTGRSSDAPVTAAIFYIGDTAEGPRLFEELRQVTGDPLTAAVGAAVGRSEQDRRQYPLDPDYRTIWPPLTTASARLSPEGDTIVVSLGGDPESDLRTRGGRAPTEARLAVEALVRTAQGAVGEALPVRVELFGRPVDRVLGVPTAQPLAASPDLDVLAPVSLTSPSQGLLVDKGEPFTVAGLAAPTEGTVVVGLVPVNDEDAVVERSTSVLGTGERLEAFEVTFDLTPLAPGDYAVVARTDDPSGTGLPVDTRTITVVDQP